MGDISRQRQYEKRLKKPHKKGAMRHENSMMEMTHLVPISFLVKGNLA